MENNKKNIILNEIFSSKKFVIAIVSISSLILFLLVFKLGIFVGFEKAKFSYRWSDNYYRNFNGPIINGPENGFGIMNEGDFMNAHGIFGQIIKIDTDSLVIKDKDNIEKIVSIKSDTSIRELRKDLKITDLKVDQKVVVIGEPDSTGKIIAKLLRVLPDNMPTPPQDSISNTNDTNISPLNNIDNNKK